MNHPTSDFPQREKSAPIRSAKSMKSSIRLITKTARVAICLALLNISVPGGALVTFGVPAREQVQATLDARTKAAKDLAARKAKSASRPLTSSEERKSQGRAGENPYMAGQSKWDVMYKGVDLMTGNYSTTATDMSFDGGYGIPVNVTRSYSANSGDEGPFGKGWTISADVRSTAGGILKSGSAPVRSVPVGFKERPSGEADPNAELATGASVQPVEAVTATDAGGTTETIQKDVDGVLTTPPWDTNVNENTQYEFVTLGGSAYQVMTHNETVTAEGTRYVYDKKGTFVGGTRPWNQPTATAQPANVLKIVSATDRQGNVTTYGYGTGTFTYSKSNGTTSENPLTVVSMPGGHQITFTWGTSGASAGRVTSISDGSGGRTVTYGYSSGMLTSVTTPVGKQTTYAYGSASTPSGWMGSVASGLLTSITDPRGLTQEISYIMRDAYYGPTAGYAGDGVAVRALHMPNGTRTMIELGNSYGVTAYVREFAAGEWDGVSTSYPLYTEGQFGVYLAATGTGVATREKSPVFTTEDGFGVSSLVKNRSIFETASQNEIETSVGAYRPSSSTPASMTFTQWHLATVRSLIEPNGSGPVSLNPYGTVTQTDTTYNFLGQPLSKTVREYPDYTNSTPSRVASVDYAYWGADKYYQQKAVRDQAGRYSFTDYYPNTAAAGRRGQTYRVYDPKHGGIGLNTSIPIPSQTPAVPSGKYWRYQVVPTTAQYSAQFDYDTQGRPIDVWKLQSTTTTPWTYVQTHTTYGADGAPIWGQANQVVEDYGGINRTTQNLAYTSWGKACDVLDAAGHRFQTVFDSDGQVQSVTRTDVTPNVTLVTYAYGATAGTVSYGQPTSVTDGLSGVVQTISYASSGTGIGQPSGVTETNGSDVYSTSYTYNGRGDRATSTYTTPQGTSRWGYGDYITIGDPTSGGRAFQTLARLDSSSNPTSEEFHYAYDTQGRLAFAAFAQSPQSGYTPSTGGSFYDGHNPSKRAVARYEYDGGGRITTLSHTWQSWGGSSYSDEALLANTCSYELSGSNRGLKTGSTFWSRNPSSPANFVQDRAESYGYDADLDYLTSANYGDGLSGATPTWSYDAAGNRNDASVVDNLNRATTLGGVAVTNDILGNRLTKSGVTYGWDCLNRLTGLSGSVTSTYQYRADGMRVAKATGGVTTRYRYDGQMGMEDFETPSSGSTTVSRYGLGARGVDFIERTTGGTVVTVFPIYDAHGNMVGDLSRSGSGYSVNDRRSFDAWGLIRSGATTGDPKGRYCASLGHKQDDESALIYMRARYYEPNSGRFVSEDQARQGDNWSEYCGNNPVGRADNSGHYFYAIDELLRHAFMVMTGTGSVVSKLAQLAIDLDKMKWMMRANGILADWMIDKGEVDQETAGLMGNLEPIEQKIGEIESGIGYMHKAEGAVASIGARMIEIMAQMVKDGL